MDNPVMHGTHPSNPDWQVFHSQLDTLARRLGDRELGLSPVARMAVGDIAIAVTELAVKVHEEFAAHTCTLRDHFAGLALQALVANTSYSDSVHAAALAQQAYVLADAMLDERQTMLHERQKRARRQAGSPAAAVPVDPSSAPEEKGKGGGK